MTRVVPTVTVITKMAISEFKEHRNRHGGHFLDGEFPTGERATCLRRRSPDHGLAARYAAREGLRRACEELGLEPPTSADQAEIIHDAFGAPVFRFTGAFGERVQGHRAVLSLAHDGDLACAMVVLQTGCSGE